MLEIPRKDLLGEALGRILSQYKESNLTNVIKALMQPFVELEDVNNDVMILRRLDQAFGVQLDIIGKLVGAGRVVNSLSYSRGRFRGIN